MSPDALNASDRIYTAERRTSDELAATFLIEGWETEPGCHAIATLHYRGGPKEFEIGKRFTESPDAKMRAAGAGILGQLGWSKATFLRESTDILVQLLADTEIDVVISALYSLGHRNDLAAVPHVITFIAHSDENIRHGAVLALSRHDDLRAIEALIRLSSDTDEDVRNWATFGLGNQTEMDTPELRNALAARLNDANAEIRGEALIGLAARHDERTLSALLRELAGPFYGSWSLEAARLLRDPRLLPELHALRRRAGEDGDSFVNDFAEAIDACTSGDSSAIP